MKTKNIIIIILCLCLIAFVPGVMGAVSVYDEKGLESYGKDRLVGILVTKEYLNISDRYYAKLVDKSFTDEETGNYIETSNYVFEDIDGYCIARYTIKDENGTYTTTSDSGLEYISNGIIASDENYENRLEGKLYYCGDSVIFYGNPVYQNVEDGSVYVVAGSGLHISGDQAEENSMSLTLQEEFKYRTGEEVITESTKISFEIVTTDVPKSYTVTEFDKNHNVLYSKNYLPGELSWIEYYPKENTEYIVVETETINYQGNIDIDRAVFDKSNTYFDTLVPNEDEVCRQVHTYLNW